MNTESTKIKASFSARFLPMIALFAAKQDIRYYLNGICIRRAPEHLGGVYVAASNGHVLGIIHDRDGSIDGGDEVIVKIDAALVAASKKRSTMPNKILVDDRRVFVAPEHDMFGTAMEAYVQPGLSRIEGKFPEFSRVIPNFENLKPGMVAAVRAEYLALFDKMLGKGKFGGVRFWQETPGDGAVVVQVLEIPELLGVVMPMHDRQGDGRALFWNFPCRPAKA